MPTQPPPVRRSARLRQGLVVSFLAILVTVFILISVLDRRSILNDPTPGQPSPIQLYEVLDPYVDKLCDIILELRSILN